MPSDDFLEFMQEELNKRMEELNSAPRPEFDNLSLTDMHHILDLTFSDFSPIGFKEEITTETWTKIPFLRLVIEYMKLLEKEGEIKLTKLGNLPRKLCFTLYGLGIITEPFIEQGFSKLNREGDSVALKNTRIICQLAGITKKRKNKMSLTAKGRKLLTAESKQELFTNLFTTQAWKFNLGFHDGYPPSYEVQHTFGYTIYLLLRYGRKRCKLNFYSQKNLEAFPYLVEHFDEGWRSREDQYESCYGIRIFERFLADYGLVDYASKKYFSRNEKNTQLKAADAFYEIFELRKEKFKFRKSKFSD